MDAPDLLFPATAKTADQSAGPEWLISRQPVAYPDALAFMEARVAAIYDGTEPEAIWLLEHPPLYTAGTSANPVDLLDSRFPVYETGRGGQYTYHGPGQRVIYVMLDLKSRTPDLRAFVHNLEDWVIAALAQFNVVSERRDGRVGIWVERGLQPTGLTKEDKIAAIGVRVRRWVTYHGIAINVEPELDHFGGIVPCGISEHGVTSLVDLGLPVTLPDLDVALQQTFSGVFNSTD